MFDARIAAPLLNRWGTVSVRAQNDRHRWSSCGKANCISSIKTANSTRTILQQIGVFALNA
jgi:hypothetical protein